MYSDVNKMMKMKEQLKKNGHKFNTNVPAEIQREEEKSIQQSIVDRIETTYSLNMEVDAKEVDATLKQIKERYDEERVALLMEGCRTSVLDCIIRPFGLAGVIFQD